MTMPMIHIHLVEGREPAQKAQLSKEVTDVAQRVLGVAAERVHVLVHEYESENWTIGGLPVRARGVVS